MSLSTQAEVVLSSNGKTLFKGKATVSFLPCANKFKRQPFPFDSWDHLSLPLRGLLNRWALLSPAFHLGSPFLLKTVRTLDGHVLHREVLDDPCRFGFSDVSEVIIHKNLAKNRVTGTFNVRSTEWLRKLTLRLEETCDFDDAHQLQFIQTEIPRRFHHNCVKAVLNEWCKGDIRGIQRYAQDHTHPNFCMTSTST